MKKNYKYLIGLSTAVATAVPVTISLASCNKGSQESSIGEDVMKATDFKDIQLIDPISGTDAKWTVDVGTGTEAEQKKALLKQSAINYYKLCQKDKKYLTQDLEHYLWEAIKVYKTGAIADFQGSFEMSISNLNFAFHEDGEYFLSANFVLNYKAALTYNDYWFEQFEGYQTQVDVTGKLRVTNLYLKLDYKNLDTEGKSATKPYLEIEARPDLETNPTVCYSTVNGKVTYYDIAGQQTTLDVNLSNKKYSKSMTLEEFADIYWTDPIFCLMAYYYKVVSSEHGPIGSYSLQYVKTTW